MCEVHTIKLLSCLVVVMGCITDVGLIKNHNNALLMGSSCCVACTRMQAPLHCPGDAAAYMPLAQAVGMPGRLNQSACGCMCLAVSTLLATSGSAAWG